MIKNDFPTLFNALAFSQQCWCYHRSWFGVEKSVIQISWFLVLFWRWEVKMHLLKNDVFHCVFIWLHGNICVLWHTRNISVQMSLFFNGLWPFVIKIISAFKRSKKCVDGQCTQQIKFTTIPGTNLALSSIFQNVTSHAKTWQTMQRNDVKLKRFANIWNVSECFWMIFEHWITLPTV